MKAIYVETRWRCSLGPVDVSGVRYMRLVASISGGTAQERDENGRISEFFVRVQILQRMDELK